MRRSGVLAALLAFALAACAQPGPSAAPPSPSPSVPPAASGSASAGHGHTATPEAAVPLRSQESFLTVGVADDLPGGVYEPAAPSGGTDDYRCFLADPGLTADSFVTGVQFLPGNADIVHHSILFRVEPAQLAAAEAKDAADPRPGWECFGGPGLPSPSSNPLDGLDAAPWLAGWAPGGHENVFEPDVGVPISARSRIVIQMHYNLRAAGAGPVRDDTSIRLRLSANQDLVPLRTMLLPAPVELPCPDGSEAGLCDRQAAVLDVMARFGYNAGRTVAGLQLLCDGDPLAPSPGTTQSCVRHLREPMTVRAAAGHMHLLGRSISIVANAGTPRERTLLDIPAWDFDNQSTRRLDAAVSLRSGDTVTVTCTHDAGLRELLPALSSTPPRYVVWGEGTTDEMCLGILVVSD